MASDFMFHNISQKEREKINEQAKSIMKSFAKKLEAVDEKKLAEPSIERDFFERGEGDVSGCEIDKEIMFENAPIKNKDFIIGEIKKWE